jgi:hypothetical protein
MADGVVSPKVGRDLKIGVDGGRANRRSTAVEVVPDVCQIIDDASRRGFVSFAELSIIFLTPQDDATTVRNAVREP